MAAFSTHINVAVVAGGALAVSMHSARLIDNTEAVLMLFLTLVGTVLPDLDSDSSKPVKIAFRLFSLVAPLLLLLSFDKRVPLLYAALFWFFAWMLFELFFFKMVLPFTKHRGVFHTIGMGILFGELFFALFYYVFHTTAYLATLAGFFILYGFIIHLLLDEIYSVDILGGRLKHSFGSACKLYSKRNLLGSLLVYAAVGAGLWLLPIDFEGVERFFHALVHIPLI